jgi:hypothetical protein
MLNYQIRPFTFEIGAFDATDYLESFVVQAPAFEMESPLIWTGNFVVRWNRRARTIDGLAQDDFDPLTNPTIWRPGQQAITIAIQGRALPILRIDRYAYDRINDRGEGTFTQILLAMDGDRPSLEPEIEVGRGTPLSAAIQKLLGEAFATSRVAAPILITGISGTIDSKIATRNPVGDAQKLCGVNWQWLTVDSQETIVTVGGDPQTRPIVFQRAWAQVDPQPDLDAIHFAAEKVIVSGSRQVPAKPDCGDNPAPENADEKGRPYYHRTQSEAPFESLFPGRRERSPQSLILSEEKEIFYAYSDRPYFIKGVFEAGTLKNYGLYNFEEIQGFSRILESYIEEGFLNRNREAEGEEAIATLTISRQPYARVFPGAEFRLGLTVASVQFECSSFQGNFVPRGLLFSNEVRTSILNGQRIYSIALYPSNVERRETKDMSRANPHSAGLDPKTGKPQCMEKPPQPQPPQPAPEIPLETESIRAECIIQPNGWLPLNPKPYPVDVGFIPSQGHADNLAYQIALQQIRRRDAMQITMPMPIEWLDAGCPLLARCLVGDGEWQIDAPIVALQNNQLAFSFSAGRIRRFTPPIPTPTQAPTYTPGGSTLLPRNTLNATVGVPIEPIQLPPGTTSSNLPAGLSLSLSGVLSGAPASTGVAPFQIQLGSQVATITLSTAPKPVGGAPATIIQQIQSRIKIDWRSSTGSIRRILPGLRIGWREVNPQSGTLNARIDMGWRRLTPPIPQIIAAISQFGWRRLTPDRQYSQTVVGLSGTSGLTSMGGDPNISLGFNFRLSGNPPVSLIVRNFDLPRFAFGGNNSKTLKVGDDGARSTGDVLVGSRGPGQYTVRWEGDATSTYTSPPDGIFELTFFEEGVIQLVLGNYFSGGTSEIALGFGRPTVSYSPTANNSYVFIPVLGGYVILQGSYN